MLIFLQTSYRIIDIHDHYALFHIAGHYALFHIAGNAQFQPSISNCKTLKRDMRHQSVQRFVNEMKIVNWNQVLNVTMLS